MADEKTTQPWTPGSWRSSYSLADEVAEIIAVGQGPDGSSLHIVDVDGANAEANGIVMAAAPALAEELAKFVRIFDRNMTSGIRGNTVYLDTPEIAAARVLLNACGWQWGGR